MTVIAKDVNCSIGCLSVTSCSNCYNLVKLTVWLKQHHSIWCPAIVTDITELWSVCLSHSCTPIKLLGRMGSSMDRQLYKCTISEYFLELAAWKKIQSQLEFSHPQCSK